MYVLVMFDSATPWTEARQASLSMEFSRQEYWSGLPFPPPDSTIWGIKKTNLIHMKILINIF